MTKKVITRRVKVGSVKIELKETIKVVRKTVRR